MDRKNRHNEGSTEIKLGKICEITPFGRFGQLLLRHHSVPALAVESYYPSSFSIFPACKIFDDSDWESNYQ